MRNDLSIAAQTVRDRVSAVDVANAMGWEIRRGRCRCPIHGGQDFNCRLYPGDRGYVCWVCKSGGDVIKLVRDSQGIGFKEALTWFNDTFGLGMDIDSPMDPDTLRKAQKAQEERRKERELRIKCDRLAFGTFLAADKVLCDLEEMRDDTMPQDADGAWDERFCFAVKMIPVAKRLVDDCMMYCTKKEG